MTLIGAIMKKVQSNESVRSNRLVSPPPELKNAIVLTKKRTSTQHDKFAHVRPSVSTWPPRYDGARAHRKLLRDELARAHIARENFRLLTRISRMHYTRGKVDSHWQRPPPPCRQYYENRVALRARTLRGNRALHRLVTTAEAAVPHTAALLSEWAHHRRRVVQLARRPFVLPPPHETLEDEAFRAPAGVVRPRVQLNLLVEGGSSMGWLRVELFSDVCPATCRLFRDLLAGDGLGYGYVGTTFFRKVPGLYWTGGDVVYDNGFGCYMQRGRREPIGAENYHFPHSMPGLLSMQVTADDEMCGMFSITFKPLPQFDLHNVVFGRVLRPSPVFEAMRQLGSSCRPRPAVRLGAARLPGAIAAANTRLVDVFDRRCVCAQMREQIKKFS